MIESPSSASDVIELAPDEVVRVLQVRPRARFQASPPAPAVSTAPPVPVSATPPVRPAVVAPPPAKTVSAPPAVSTSRRRERSLEETLDDLQALVTMGTDEDTGSTTGVRHLRVELEKPLRSAKKR